MAQWSKTKVYANNINNGNEYERKDHPTRQQLNAIVNNSLYASNIAENVASQISNLDPNEKIEFKGSNPNLLINGDFRVNQRGKESYNFADMKSFIDVYTVDRWKVRPQTTIGSISKTSQGLSIIMPNQYDTFSYVFENTDANKLVSKTVTLSCKVNNIDTSVGLPILAIRNGRNTNISYTSITKTGIVRVTGAIPTNLTELRVVIAGNCNVVVDYIKLEVGSVATSFSPRPYAEELLMCMRLYQLRSSSYTMPTNVIDCAIPMRKEHTRGQTTINGTNYNFIDAEIY